MSDCAQPNGRWSGVTWRQPEHMEINDPQPTLPIRVEFDRGRAWEHPLALNGRVIRGVYVDGERYERVRECRDASLDRSTQFYCSECECTVDVPLAWGAVNYCPGCGARIRKAVKR